MTVAERVSYLRGLSDGLGIDTESKEGKMFEAIIDTLDAVAANLAEIEENALDIGDELDALSDDLGDVEDIVYGDDEDDEDDDICSCCGDCGQDDFEAEYSVTCPKCGEEIELDEDVLDLGEISCPNCGEKLEFDFDEDEEDEDE